MKQRSILTATITCPECREELSFQFHRRDGEPVDSCECPECNEIPDDYDLDMAINASVDSDLAAMEDYYDGLREDARLFGRNSNL